MSNVLRFYGKVPRGESVVLIGNYAGGENAIFTALQKTIRQEKSAALYGLFGKYIEEAYDNQSPGNLLTTINANMVNAILDRNGQHLWGDQVFGNGSLGIIRCVLYELFDMILSTQV